MTTNGIEAKNLEAEDFQSHEELGETDADPGTDSDLVPDDDKDKGDPSDPSSPDLVLCMSQTPAPESKKVSNDEHNSDLERKKKEKEKKEQEDRIRAEEKRRKDEEEAKKLRDLTAAEDEKAKKDRDDWERHEARANQNKEDDDVRRYQVCIENPSVKAERQEDHASSVLEHGEKPPMENQSQNNNDSKAAPIETSSTGRITGGGRFSRPPDLSNREQEPINRAPTKTLRRGL